MTRHSLSSRSNQKLLSHLRQLVKKEKQTTLSILLHLAEVDHRELYLGYGFSSLFDYCIGASGYSESAAGRRMATARCIRRFPEIYDLLESREVSVTTVGLVAPILTEENKTLVLTRIRGKSRRQAKTAVAGYKPPLAYRDRVRPVRVAVTVTGQTAEDRCKSLIFHSRRGNAEEYGNRGLHGGSRPTAIPPDQTGANRSAAADTSADSNGGAPSLPASRIEKRLFVQFLASEGFMAKLDDVESLLSNKIPGGSFEDVFETLIDEFLERHSPARKHQRRDRREHRRTAPGRGPNAAQNRPKSQPAHQRQIDAKKRSNSEESGASPRTASH